jgi:hypothetical protein
MQPRDDASKRIIVQLVILPEALVSQHPLAGRFQIRFDTS